MNGAPAVHVLSAALLAALLVPASGLAQTSSSSNSNNDDTTVDIDRVSVVGSRIRRAQIEGPAPVTVITREELDREGFMTVGDALQTLTQNTTSSFTGDQAVDGFTPNAQVVNLRGLGPGYTLTLINGRRPAQYPYPYNRDNNVVNVNAIPSSIVERVEILSGGASAIYGSDAVAGVVNIVLRENYDGNSVRVTAGTTEHGGGDYRNIELVGGRSGDRWSGLWAFQYNQRDPVFASQRRLLRDTRNGPLGDLANPSLTHIAISGGLSVPQEANAVFPGAAGCEALGMVAWNTARRGDFCGSFTSNGARSISNKREFYSAYGYGTFDITERTQLWASANYYSTKAKASSGTEFYGTLFDPFIPGTAFFYDPNIGDYLQLQRVFLPHEVGGNEAVATQYDEYAYDVAAGIRGSFADRFDWEASASYGLYNYEADRPRMLAQAVNSYFLSPVLGTTTASQGIAGFQIRELNLARWNAPLTREIYESFATRVVNVSETTASTAAFAVNGDLFELPAGPVGFAGLLEWSQQKIDMRSDPRINPLRPLDEQTILNLVGSGQTYGVRDRYALGVELRVPIFSQLSAQLAARRDKYDDISNVDAATTYNVGLEWRPASNFLLRGSYATSFRAPDMQLVYAEGAASFSGIFDEYACRAGVGAGAAGGPRTPTQCRSVNNDPTRYTAQTVIAGNPGLEEEEGKSWVAGFVWDIIDGMSITADWYRIKLEGAAAQLSSAALLQREADCRIGATIGNRPMPSAAECAQVLGLIARNDVPGSPDFLRIQRINNAYINTAVTDTSGIDANWRWRLNTDRAGSFNFNVAYSLVLTNKYQQTAEDELTDYRDLPPTWFYPERSRMRGSVTWSYGDWSTTLFGTRYGSTWSAEETEGTNDAGGAYGHRLAPFMLYNLSVGRKFGPNVDGMIQVANLFDRQYRKDNSDTGYPFYNIYNGSNPIGRQFYVSLAYRF